MADAQKEVIPAKDEEINPAKHDELLSSPAKMEVIDSTNAEEPPPSPTREEDREMPDASESDSEDEDDEEDQLRPLEIAVAENPQNYDAHVEYIKALRKYGQVEKLRAAREGMHALFPLSATMWQEWAKDEACLNTGFEAIPIVESLYEQGVHEYLSVALWFDYLNFIQEHDELVLQCIPKGIEKMRSLFERALTAAGLHVAEGGKLWAAYREYEQALLITMEENDAETKAKQVDRIRNLFYRQLSVPLADTNSTLEEYKLWEEQQGNVVGNDVDHLAGLSSNVTSAYKKAVQMYNAHADHEEKIAAGKHAGAELLQHYLSYISYEVSSGDPARVQILYERAIAEFPVTKDLWLGYTQYLDSNLKVSSIIKAVYARAVWNCPWVEELWRKYLLALERFHSSEEDIHAVFERSLQCGFSNPDEYLDLFLTRADGLRRRIMTMDEAGNVADMPLLREIFQRAAEYFADPFIYRDQLLHLHTYWGRLEAKLAKDLAAARGVWENLIKRSGWMLEAWQGYIAMELALNNVNEARAIYKRCYSRRFKDNGSEAICESWLRFEREYGSLEDFDRALTKVTPRLTELRLFRLQQEAKTGQLAEPESSVQKDDSLKISTKEKGNAPKPSNMQPNNLKTAPKRKTGVDYHEEKIQLKRKKGVYGKASPLDVLEKERELGSNKAENTETNTAPSEVQPRLSDQQMEEAKNLKSTKKLLYTDQCTAFISNLSSEVNEEHIRQFFNERGGVKAIRLLRDRFSGKSRGLAYVDFDNEEYLAEAVAKNKQKLLGVKVSIARSNPNESQRRSARGGLAKGKGGRAPAAMGSGTKTQERQRHPPESVSALVSHRRGGHVSLTGSNTFAVPRNVARPLGWGIKDGGGRSTETEEPLKSNEEFRKMFLKS